MDQQVPFIDREQELWEIDGLIHDWNSRRAMFVHAEGGIGKSRLLQEVRKRYAGKQSKNKPLIVSNIIDFDNRRFYLSENLENEIANLLKEDNFKAYFEALQDERKMKAAGVSVASLAKKREETQEAFRTSYNDVAAEKRIVLLFDTTESMRGDDPWNYLQSLIPAIKNTFFLFAGRNADDLFKTLKPQLSGDAILLKLQSFEEKASEAYLQEKQKLLGINIKPSLAKNLLWLARGRPIIIDLAVDWLARDIPLEWLTQYGLEELEKLPQDEETKLRREFESRLVSEISQVRSDEDRLVLVLSRVYPMDTAMAASLLGIDLKEAAHLVSRAQAYAFIKVRPDGRITLHDEMRRLVEMYVWPGIDPDGNRRRRDSRRAAACLAEEVSKLKEEMAKLEADESAAKQTGDAAAAFEAFTRRELLDQEMWVLETRRLKHTLFADLDAGVEAFAEIFDAATQSYRLRFRGALIEEMEPYVKKLSAEQRYAYNSRKARHLLDSGEYAGAKKIVENILKRKALSAERRVEAYIQLGNTHVREGNYHKGIDAFEKAAEISQSNHLDRQLVLAKIALGWANRLIGDLDAAEKCYSGVLQIAFDLSDKKMQALLMNNIGYVKAIKRVDIDKAIGLCEQALENMRDLKDQRGEGAVYSTLGEINRISRNFSGSIDFFAKALGIFEPVYDKEWLARVYSGRGSTFWLNGEYDRAKDDLRYSLRLGIKLEEAGTMRRLALVYWSQKELDEATNWLEKSYRLADQTNDFFTVISSLAHLAWLDYDREEFRNWYHWQNEFNKLKKKLPEVKFGPRRGLLLKRLGDLAIRDKKYDLAFDFYRKGFPELVHALHHEPIGLWEQLKSTEKDVLPFVPKEKVQKLGQVLWREWYEQGLAASYIDALAYFARWRKWG